MIKSSAKNIPRTFFLLFLFLNVAFQTVAEPKNRINYILFGNTIPDLDYYAGIDTSNYRYNGKELEKATNYLEYGRRQYDPQIGRFFNQDRFSEKYYPLSPYQYAANNPISNIDVGGDSIWVTTTSNTQYFSNGSQSTSVNHTIHITGKVLDASDSFFDAGDVAAGIQSGLNAISATNYSKSGNNEISVNIGIDANIGVAGSMSDVSASDHLITVVDNVTGSAETGGPANGLGAGFGKISYVEGSSFGNSDMIKTGIHELGHNMGLALQKHPLEDNSNYMSYGGNERKQFSFSQLNQVVINGKNGKLNQGQNSSISQKSSNNLLWNKSTNEKPYDFNVKKGERIPRILTNK